MLSFGGRHRLRHGFRVVEVAHDPEKWEPVFGKDHAQGNSMNEVDRKISAGGSCPLCGKPVDAAFKPVLLQALRRYRSQSLARRRLCCSGERGRRRGRRAAGRERRGRALMNAPILDWPDKLFATLKRAGVAQVGYVPDAGHSRLIERCRADTDIRDVVLTTEEEGVALAAGAWLGGERAALLMQSSGARQLRQHAVAGTHLPLSAADVHHHARRMGGVQSLAAADGIDRRTGAEIVRGASLSRD